MSGIQLEIVHEDSRGMIYSLALPTKQELMVFLCNAGARRGGHSHDVREIVLVLSGKLRYHKLIDGQEVVLEKGAGDFIYNEPGEPHMAEFLENTWVAEFKIGSRIGEWTTTDYLPFREKVLRKSGQ